MTPDGLVFEDCRPPKPFRTITHHIVGLFKDHFSGTTDAGFRCHCGHKGGVQFIDYQAMTSPVAWVLPSVVCDRVIAAWRAHTKDLDGVHPNAEDQIRDFLSRQLEQPGGPTMTTPRYSLTAIPLETPRPKSITISAFVDEELRRIIVDYAGKLGIVVTPVESRWFDWLVTDCPTSLKSATPAAMREYLARLLYGDEGIVENLLADEKGDNPWRQMPIPSKEMRAAWEKWDCLFAEPYGKRCSLHTHIFRGNLQNFSGWGEPDRFDVFDEKNFNTSPNIFWRPSGKTWAEVDEKVENTTNEIGRLAAEAAAQGKGTFRADVKLADPLNFSVFNIRLRDPEEQPKFPPVTKIPEGTHLPSHITIVESDTLAKLSDVEDIWLLAGELGIPCGHLGKINRSFVGNHPWVVTEDPCSADFLCGAKVTTAAAMRDFLHAERDRAWAKKQDARVIHITPTLNGELGSYSGVRIIRELDEVDAEDAVAPEEQPVNNDRPTRIILRSYAADDKPHIERLLGLARQLQLPVQLAGPWSCTAFPKGEEAHPALDVVFPEVLVHPRDVLIVAEGQQPLTEIENQLLWAAREDDQRFITGLVKLLGLPADASRGDIAAAVERSGTHYEALDVRVRNILGAVDGEETDEAARRLVEASRGDIAAAVENKSLDGVSAEQAHRQRARYEECDAQVREILSASQGEEAVEAAKRVMAELAEWRVERSERNRHAAKELGEKLDSVHRDLAKRLGLPSDTSWFDIMSAVERIVEDSQDHAEVRENNGELGAYLGSIKKERDNLKEQLETAITAERQTIARRIDLALTGNAAVTNLDTMLRAVEACREGYTREASRSVNLRRDCVMLQDLIGQIADALDAPPGDRLVVKDDGSLNTTLADRVVGYFKRLYTAAGFTEPPQGGWSEILSNVEDTLAGECPLPSR